MRIACSLQDFVARAELDLVYSHLVSHVFLLVRQSLLVLNDIVTACVQCCRSRSWPGLVKDEQRCQTWTLWEVERALRGIALDRPDHC